KIEPRERTRGEGMTLSFAAWLELGLPRLSHCTRRLLGVLPSPLWGGVGGGGRSCCAVATTATPLPTPPPQGGGGQTERASRANPNHTKCDLRRAVLISLLVGILCSLVAAVASAETLRVGKAGREAFSFVPADVGERTGIFKRHGVEIEISNFGGDARLQQAMAADGIDVALGSGPGLAFIVKGAPVKGIAAMAWPPLLLALVVRNDDTIKNADDLKGRKIGGSTGGSVTSWIVSEVSRQQGWGYAGVTQVPIGDDANRIAALKTKSIDAAIVNLAQALNFVQRGEGRVLLRF